MTLTVNVSEELGHKLEAEATRNGVSTDEFIKIVLEEKLRSQPNGRKPPFESKIIATDVPVRDFSREQAWLAEHRDEYDGQYVALDGDTLLAADPDAKEITRKVRLLGKNGVYVVFVEGSNRPPFISGGLW